MRQHKVFLRHELLKYNSEKSTAKSSALENYISSANLSLSGCSSAEPDSVSVGACKFQMKKLYLQTVKKVDHLPHITGNVLLKCGLLHLKFLLKTARSKKCFPLTKLIKKWRRKHFLRLNFTKFSTQEPSIPHFSNTMLCDVAIFHNFLFI